MTEPKQYKIVMSYSLVDEVYVAEVVNWKYISAHGDTPEEALRELAASVELGREVEKLRAERG